MTSRCLSVRCTLGALGVWLLLSSHAYADAISPTMRIRLQDIGSGSGVVLTDNGTGDLDPLIGSIFFNGSVGGFGVNFTGGTSAPLIGGVYNEAELALSSTNIRTTSGTGKLRITLEDINYGPEYGSHTVSGFVSGNMTGANGNSATFNAWASPTNGVPNLGPNVGPVASLLGPIGALPADAAAVWPGGVSFGITSCSTPLAPGCSISFSGSGATTLAASGGYYSLFTELLLSLTGPSALSISALNVAVTPEPTTMLLFGTGASAVAWARRRRKGREAHTAVPA